MLKIGLVGIGHLGKIHLRLLKGIADFEVVGIYDADSNNAEEVSKEFSVNVFHSIDDLLDNVDVVDVVTPTLSHFEIAEKALKKSLHVFIEKPVTNTVKEAKKLLELMQEANVKVQVGHVERFNPAYTAVVPYLKAPLFIETHRLAQFNPRGTDVPVVLDLMIHDIDIILKMVQSPLMKISASGVAIVSDTPDIANVRLEFASGCVANLTASRISMKNMRKTRVFQSDAYITVDFLEKKAEVIKIQKVEGEPDPLSVTVDLGEGKGVKEILFDQPKIQEVNAIEEELKSFASAIINNTTPVVSLHDGVEALRVAHEILENLKNIRQHS